MLEIDKYQCCGCNYCTFACQYEAISYIQYEIVVDREKCKNCGACVYFCPNRAIYLVKQTSGGTE
ncbi:MAG: 4Fe-4S binding protein [Candidatus Helarchaeota archaeon]